MLWEIELGYKWTRTCATESAYEKCNFWLANIKKKKNWKKIKKMKFTESFTGYFFVLWELT